MENTDKNIKNQKLSKKKKNFDCHQASKQQFFNSKMVFRTIRNFYFNIYWLKYLLYETFTTE